MIQCPLCRLVYAAYGNLYIFSLGRLSWHAPPSPHTQIHLSELVWSEQKTYLFRWKQNRIIKCGTSPRLHEIAETVLSHAGESPVAPDEQLTGHYPAPSSPQRTLTCRETYTGLPQGRDPDMQWDMPLATPFIPHRTLTCSETYTNHSLPHLRGPWRDTTSQDMLISLPTGTGAYFQIAEFNLSLELAKIHSEKLHNRYSLKQFLYV